MSNYVTSLTTPGSGTFTVPTGCTLLNIECWGAGGAGHAWGGGGSGCYISNALTVTAGQVINFYVGAGTTGDGEDTWFNTATHTMAKGGKASLSSSQTFAGGLGGDGTLCRASGSSQDLHGISGGNGGQGAVNGLNDWAGGGGGSIMQGNEANGIPGTRALSVTSPGTAGMYLGVSAGPTGKGGTGKTGNANTVKTDGVVPTAPGGGGGGGGITSVGSAVGHNGARGEIRLTYTATPGGGTPGTDNDDFFLIF